MIDDRDAGAIHANRSCRGYRQRSYDDASLVVTRNRGRSRAGLVNNYARERRCDEESAEVGRRTRVTRQGQPSLGGVKRVACKCERERARRTGRDDGSELRRRLYCPRAAAGAYRLEFRRCAQKENFSLVRRGRSRLTFSERRFFFRVDRENSAKILARRATVNSFAGRPGLVYFCILRH